MLRSISQISLVISTLALAVGIAHAESQSVITFDGAAAGNSVAIDLDTDSQADVTFSSLNGESLGIETFGNTQTYISEPALTQSEGAGPEIRIDFAHGLDSDLSLDFSTSWGCGSFTGAPDQDLTLTVTAYDGDDTAIATETVTASCLEPQFSSDFAEGRIVVTGAAGADYALVDLNDATPEPFYMIDNVSGVFLTSSDGGSGTIHTGGTHSVPALPTPALLILIAVTAFLGRRFNQRR